MRSRPLHALALTLLATLSAFAATACDPSYTVDVPAPPVDNDPASKDQGNVGTVAAPPMAVVEHHNGPTRDGLYVVPGLTHARAAALSLDADFAPSYSGGVVEAQPLYVPNGPSGAGAYYVVSNSNDVMAIDETTGETLWKQNFGPPADRMSTACGGQNRLGIDGTPYIDLASRTLYVDSIRASGEAGSRIIDTHLVHALSIDDGSEKKGWPVDASEAVSAGSPFDPTTSGQRGALAVVNGTLYVPYGSIGDCGDYHGSIVAIDTLDPTKVTAWVMPGKRGGLWSALGIASDGEDIYFSTGNGLQDTTEDWAGGTALMRLPAKPLEAKMPSDYFVPPNWRDLDLGDLDITGVVLVAQPQSTPPLLAIETGKDGIIYVLDAKKLGGVVGTKALSQPQVATKNFVSGIAAVPNDLGTMLVLDAETSGKGVGCPNGQSGNIVGVQLIAGTPPEARTVWCVDNHGHGTPIVTTTDGRTDAIAWVYGATGENRLRGYDAQSGDVIYDGGDDDSTVMSGIHRFSTLIAANGRLVVAGDSRMYAFTF